MFNEKIKEFYSKVSADQVFKEKLLKVKENYENLNNPKEKFYKIANELLLPYAKNLGFNFSVEDLLDYEKQVTSQKGMELGENDLESVSGGLSATFPSICLSALMGLTAFSGLLPVSQSQPESNTIESKSSYSYNIDKNDASSPTKNNVSNNKTTFNFGQSTFKNNPSDANFSLSKNIEREIVNRQDQSTNKQENPTVLSQVSENDRIKPSNNQGTSENTTTSDVTFKNTGDLQVAVPPVSPRNDIVEENYDSPPPVPPRNDIVEENHKNPPPVPPRPSVSSETNLNDQTVMGNSENKNSESKPSDRAGFLAEMHQGKQLKRVDTTPKSPTLLSQITKGVNLKPVVNNPTLTENAPKAPNLLDEIKMGKQLKHVEPPISITEKGETPKEEKDLHDQLVDSLKSNVEKYTQRLSDNSDYTNPEISDEEWE